MEAVKAVLPCLSSCLLPRINKHPAAFAYGVMTQSQPPAGARRYANNTKGKVISHQMHSLIAHIVLFLALLATGVIMLRKKNDS